MQTLHKRNEAIKLVAYIHQQCTLCVYTLTYWRINFHWCNLYRLDLPGVVTTSKSMKFLQLERGEDEIQRMLMGSVFTQRSLHRHRERREQGEST